ncbi:MAG: stage II sporulation protein D [Vallitalea sp.]|nr:stage II sporulation protein D [Vallitalea sp.]
MREKVISILLIIIIICFIPIFITTLIKGIPKNYKKEVDTQVQQSQSVRVMVNDEEQVIKLEDYLIGVVAAEMPVNFYDEALKAQAVAARTYTLKKLKSEEKFIFTSNEQAFITKQEMETRWGTNNFAKNYNKIKKAVQETKNEVIAYKGELIEAVFHSTSAGKTQSAKEVWGEDIPYLVSVESSEDINSPEYLHKRVFTKEEFIEKIKENEQDFQTYSKELVSEIQIINRTPEGYIAKIQVGNKILEGEKIRNYLGLESSNFTIQNADGKIEILCKGYGHGVGMSQYGADFLAQKGYNYKEILNYYYTNIEVTTN